MKKILEKVLLIFISTLVVFCFSGCSKPSHTHEYAWYLAIAPTQEQVGLLEGICTCGKKQMKELPKLESSGGEEEHQHSYGWNVVKAPTCNEQGLLEGYCGCGDKIERVLEPKGHTFSGEFCSVCGIKKVTIYIDEEVKLGYNFRILLNL